MSFIRIALIVIALVIATLLGFMYFTFDSDYQLKVALEEFQKENYEESLDALEKVGSAVPKSQIELYEAYVARAQKHVQKSTDYLSQAEKYFDNKLDRNLLLEIYFNQLFNAYLLRDSEKYDHALKQAKNIAPSNGWTLFFDGLDSFLHEQYSASLKEWADMGARVPLSAWMKKSFDSFFDADWMTLYVARAKLETGDYLTVRQQLIEATHTATTEQLIQLNFLIGLTYIKEAEEKPASSSLPYYKLAFSYFSKVPMLDKQFDLERQKLIRLIDRKIPQLIQENSLQDLAYFVAVLESWNARANLQEISNQLTTLLKKQIKEKKGDNIRLLADMLQRILPPGELRTSLAKSLEVEMRARLKEQNMEGIENYWDAVLIFTANPVEFKNKFTAEIQKQIFDLIDQDDSQLTKSMPYITFLAKIDQNPEEKIAVSRRLLESSTNYWKQTGQEGKSLSLLKAVNIITPVAGNSEMAKAVSSTLDAFYTQALQTDRIGDLPELYQLGQELNLSISALKDPKTLKDHLLNAQSAFEQKRYEKAKENATWVLLLDPQNRQALYIIGLVDYIAGDYEKAKQLLEKIPSPSPEILEALAVSQMLSNDLKQGEANLQQVQRMHALNPDTYLRLGMGLVSEKKFEAGVNWLKKIQKPDSEVNAALTLGYYSLGNWQAALQHFQQLQEPYKSLDGLNAIAIWSFVALNKFSEAEKLLNSWVNSPPQPSNDKFPPLFIELKTKLLDSLDRYYIAALFYKDVKKQNEKALEYFDKMDRSSPEIILQKGEIYLSLKKYNEAIQSFKQAIQLEGNPSIRSRAIPGLAKIYREMQKDYDAYNWYNSYLTVLTQDPSQLSAYAEILMKIRRFDLAKEQYQKIQKAEKLNPRNLLGYLTTLVNTNRFSTAESLAKESLEQKPPLSLADQLNIGDLMAIIKKDYLFTALVQKVLAPGYVATDAESQAVMRLLLTLGAYQEASVVANSYGALWEKSAQGLLLLAEWNQRLSLYDAAISLAQKALKKEPNNREVQEFLIENQLDLSKSKEEALARKAAFKDSQAPLTDAVLYAQAVLHWLFLEKYLPNDTRLELSIELEQINLLIERLSRQHAEIPIYHFILAQIEYLSGNYEEAAKSYQAALKLDVSYSDAAIYAALTDLQRGNFRDPDELIAQALKYAPDKELAWKVMGKVSVKLDSLEQAIYAFNNAIKFRPRDYTNYVELGEVYLSVKNPESALATFDSALQLNPKDVDTLVLLLKNLYDPALEVVLSDSHELELKRQEVYNHLHELNPALAEKLWKELNPNQPPDG